MVMPRALLDGTLTENLFMAQVLDLAVFYRWSAYHTHDSRRSAAGWPDLALVRNGRLILAELKTETGKVSAAQGDWLEELRQVEYAAGGAVEVHMWRPSDWNRIVEALR